MGSSYLRLAIWMVALIAIGSIIGLLTKPEISTWYSTLNRSPLTPPNYVFPIVWTILYGAIGASGSIIWSLHPSSKVGVIKGLYIFQLVLNWSWTPLFFCYHLVGIALAVLIFMDVLVGMLIYLSCQKTKSVPFLMAPYLLWLLLATHLNFYVWQYN